MKDICLYVLVCRCSPWRYIWSVFQDYRAALCRQVLLTVLWSIKYRSHPRAAQWYWDCVENFIIYCINFPNIIHCFPSHSWLPFHQNRKQQRWYLDSQCALEDVWNRRSHGPQYRQAPQRSGQHADVPDGRGGHRRHRRSELCEHCRPFRWGRNRLHVTHHAHGQTPLSSFFITV